ncbi:protein kinase [Nonomuraea sp. NPDC005983]|uniref:serine/threonine-protein kinase n=1 Tax=Nonomuraea sp. NPDC005983 TaxID=3155595 RepID=UPI0033B0412F
MGVPGYTEVRELGHGGTGRVMLAVRDSDGSHVAIKHLSAQLRQDERFVNRFRAEALVIKDLDSPHTARLLEYVEGEDDAVIVMELVDGVTLRRLLQREGATGAEAALVVLKGALLGLAEAHRNGVVHRDFKPENVIVIPDGQSRLVDFGVAAHSGETAPLVGTPSYMAPEQWEDAPASPATDVYAAAVVFFECLTGRRPFAGENVAALAYQHQHASPPLGDIDEPLRQLVEHGLAKDPAGRPESAEAFLAELEETAAAVHGDDWETRGRLALGSLTVPFTMLLPMAKPAPETGTSLFQTTFAPTSKVVLTGGLVLATAAAVATAFVIWQDPVDNVDALRPATSPPPTVVPASPPPATRTPEPTVSMSPPATFTAAPSPYETAPPPSFEVLPPTTRSREPAETRPLPTRTREPTRESTRVPTRAPTRRPTTRPTPEPTRPEPTRSETRPPATQPPATQPPATRPPDPGTPPPGRTSRPLLSVSVKVSLDVPVLSGKGDRLLDADIGLGLGTGLLGLVVVPGSVLLGRQIVVRRTRRPRDTEMK